MPAAWENVLQTLVPTDYKVVDRDEFAGAGSAPWIASVDYTQLSNYKAIREGGDSIGDPATTWDVYLPFRFSGEGSMGVDKLDQPQVDTLYIGVNLDHSVFTESGPWGRILRIGQELLDPVATIAPYENTAGGKVVVSIESVNFFQQQLREAADQANGWADRLAQQAQGVGSGEQLSGEAAKSYQSLLESASKEVREFAVDIADPGLMSGLDNAKDALATSVNKLLSSFQEWRQSELMSPAAAVAKAMEQVNFVITVSQNGRVENISGWGYSSLGVESEDFRKDLDQTAKNLWLNNYSQTLDAPAAQAKAEADRAFQAVVRSIPSIKMGQIASTYTAPQPDGANDQLDQMQQDYQQQMDEIQQQQDELAAGPGGGTDGLTPEGQAELTPDGQAELTPDGQAELTPDGQAELAADDLTGGDGETPDLDTLDEVDDQGLGGSKTQNLLADPTGLGGGALGDEQQMGGSGPLMAGPGTIGFGKDPLGSGAYNPENPAGTSSVIGPDGSVVRGPDGVPLSVPSGSTVNPDGTITKPDGTLLSGPDGEPIKVDPNSSIRPNQQLFNPDGSLATDESGNPIYAPPGSTVGTNGQILDPKGQSMLTPGGRFLSSMDPHTGSLKTSRLAFDPPGTRTVGPLSSPEIGDPAKRLTTNSSALDDALRKPTHVATETGMRGHGTNGNQSPMMPPPMAGGAAGGNEKERQRNTWLTEDPEQWGSEGGFTTAIGR